MTEHPYIHRDSSTQAPDAWRKLWVVAWRMRDGREFEREHFRQAAADANAFELAQDSRVVAIFVEGARVK